ncbi:hypothetical protein D5H75_08140 [Bailinhaonella thermotolerans]|uniref:Uncharacterized protein n=1 Tax=Bailinhaonella thermotolerans TaxID=1070861 RepID=A0A3A4AWS8_9ACTN|nr:hypothetical protein D5H75_08140 [Bailinhaonella thermotolerans]
MGHTPLVRGEAAGADGSPILPSPSDRARTAPARRPYGTARMRSAPKAYGVAKAYGAPKAYGAARAYGSPGDD